MNTIGNLLTTQAATKQETCVTHGPYESRNVIGKIWSRCPQCATEEVERMRVEVECRAREEKRRAWERKIGMAGIPDRFRTRTLESYIAKNDGQRRVLAFAKDYADNFAAALETGRSALFIGTPGTGKTHLAVGIALQIMQQRRTVLFTSVLRAIRRIKETWSKGSKETETQAIAALVFPDLLILDEVGIQFGSEAEKLLLFDVLNERYEKRRPTILLSNLTKDEVVAYLGERIIDRIREDGGSMQVFNWESARGTLANAHDCKGT